MSRSSPGVATRCYALLVRVLLPRSIRQSFGDKMMLTFGDLYREARRRGRIAAARTVLREFWSLVSMALGERKRERPNSPSHFGEKPAMFGSFAQDLRHASRTLRKNPGLTAVVIITLALGIGANTAIFSVIHGVLLRPLPYAEPDQLVRIFESNPQRGWDRFSVSPANFVDWRAQNDAFTAIAAYETGTVTRSGAGQAEAIESAAVSAGTFDMLGVPPVLGRAFALEEEQPGNDRVVLLSHGYWNDRMGADMNALGTAIQLEGNAYTVVGVMPEGFSYPTPGTAIWRPLAFSFDVSGSRGAHYLAVVGRLEEGIALEEAGAAMRTIANRLAAEYPETNEHWTTQVDALLEITVGSVRPILFVLFGAVGLVLLIACANVANLLLVHAVSKSRELAVRVALGAGRARLMRLLVSESVLLAFLGGAGGLVLGALSLKALVALAPANIPRLHNVDLNLPVLGFTLGLSLLTGIVVGSLPALRASRSNVHEVLQESGRVQGASVGTHRLHGTLVVSQIALAVVLVIGAGLLLRSFVKLSNVDPGFGADRALIVELTLPRSRYADDEQVTDFHTQLQERLAALPGVQTVGAVTQPPLNWWSIGFSFTVADQPPADPANPPSGDFRVATPGYFDAMGITLLRGRVFTAHDTHEAPPVIVINEQLAQQFFPDRDPLGARIRVHYGDETEAREVVGIVVGVRQRSLHANAQPGYYLPLAQVRWSTMNVVINTASDPSGLVPSVRREIAQLDADLALMNVQTINERFSDVVARPRFNLWLVSLFAAVALALGTIGIHGVMTYLVTERTQEIGVRMALGASAGSVLRMVSIQGLKLVLLGVVIGELGALALTRWMSSLLFEVSATDVMTFALVAGILIVVAWVSTYLPAVRASRLSPMDALRLE